MENFLIYGEDSISSREFSQFQQLIYDIAGINLSEAKKVLLVGRLSKRLRALGLHSFSDYFRHLSQDNHAQERQTMVDLITTNETYFFREPQHFEFLREKAARCRTQGSFRVWSAASSSGEEAYSTAMVLADTLGMTGWDIVGTDISTKVLSSAHRGLYSLERTHNIPKHLLKQYCLKGIMDQQGMLLISRALRERTQFMYCNLLEPQRVPGPFDVIFLRNVMIYFNQETKQKVIANLLPYLKRDGHLIIGHSESLHGISTALVAERPTIYRLAPPRPVPAARAGLLPNALGRALAGVGEATVGALGVASR